MATLAQNYQQDDEDKNKPISSAAPTVMGGSQPSGTIASQGASQAGNQAGASSGRFSNITNYLQANKPQQSLGQKIAGNIQGQGQKVQGNLQNQQQQFGKESEANRNVFNQGLVNNALNNAASFVQDENQFNQFQKQRTGQYAGPTALSDEAALNAQASNLQRQGQATGTEAGQFGLLRQMFGRPSYSQGQQKLDQLFVQSGPKNQFSQARRAANQTGQQVSQGEQQAGLLGKTYGQEAKSTNEATTNALTGKTQEEYKTLDQRVAEEKAKKEAAVAAIQGQLSRGQLASNLANGLGGGRTYGLNLNSFLNVDPTEANRATVAGAEDYAKFNALNKLAGQQGPATEFADQSQAGRFLQNQYGFDKERFQQQLASQQAAYDAQKAAINARKTGALFDVGGSSGVPAAVALGMTPAGVLGSIGGLMFGGSKSNLAGLNGQQLQDRAQWLGQSYDAGQDLAPEDRQLVESYRAAQQKAADLKALEGRYGGSYGVV